MTFFGLAGGAYGEGYSREWPFLLFAITPYMVYNIATVERKNIYFEPDIWEKAMAKAKSERRSMAAVLRRLLELWIDKKIDLDLSDIGEKGDK